jgi:probable HAF family extracellular repeat protein
MDCKRFEWLRWFAEALLRLLAAVAVTGASTAWAAGLEQKALGSALKSFSAVRQAAPAAVAPAASTSTAAYEFVTIDAPGEPATNAYGVNDTGLVSGYFNDVNLDFHGFLWHDGRLQTHDYPQALETALGDSNNAGIVIGNYGDVAQHAVLFDAELATWTTLPDIPNLPVNLGDGINNRGVATGVACQGNFVSLAFTNCLGWTWNGRSYSLFSAPGANLPNGGTSAQGINDRNQVAGSFTDANFVNHGFVKDGDDYTIVDVPGATNTFVFDINDRGEAVGYYIDAAGAYHGFVERQGKFTTVDFPGAVLTLIFGNDARGDLAGAWVDPNNVAHGFVAWKR